MSIGKSSINRTTKTIAAVRTEETAKISFSLSEIKLTELSAPETEVSDKLVSSIKKYGVLEPVTLARYGEDKYLILSGEKRFNAALACGLEKIPCVIINAKDKKEAENFRKELIKTEEKKTLDPIHEAKFIAATTIGRDMPDFLL